MFAFREWLMNEAAMGPNSIRYDAQGRPNFRVYIMNDGGLVGLETLQNGQYKFAGDMFSNIFGDSSLLRGRKIFNWHSDLPEGSGYGPMFYDICMEIATIKGGHLASMTLVNRLALVSSGKDFDYEQSKERKGASMGDTSDRAEPIYKFYYEKRGDVEKVDPGVRVAKLRAAADRAGIPKTQQSNLKGHMVGGVVVSVNSRKVRLTPDEAENLKFAQELARRMGN